jgi:hypothetical protein
MKYLLEKVLVHHSDKNKLNYNSRVETIFTEYNTLEKLRKNIILENDTEYFIYYVDDKFKLKDNSLDFDENEENGFDDNYLQNHCIGAFRCNHFCYAIDSEVMELENEANDIIRDYEYEHENNYNEDELKKLLKDFFENNKKIEVEEGELCIDNTDIDIFICKLINSHSILLNCDRYFQQYLDFEINNYEKIMEERFSQENTQTDDFEL